MCGARACCFRLMYVCVVLVVHCVMVNGLYVFCVFVWLFNAFVCGVCDLLVDVAWLVVVWFAVVCDLLCGVVWFVLLVCLFVCCVFVCCL